MLVIVVRLNLETLEFTGQVSFKVQSDTDSITRIHVIHSPCGSNVVHQNISRISLHIQAKIKLARHFIFHFECEGLSTLNFSQFYFVY